MTLKRSLPGAFESHLTDLKDPRVERTKRYSLTQLLFMAFTGVLVGCEGPDMIAAFVASKRTWFEQWFELPDGTPCGDTFERVLARLAPKPFAQAFAAWLASLRATIQGELLAVDGKSIKGAFESASRTTPLHLLHVWATEQQCLLAHVAVPGASGEAPALPALLAQLEIAGCVVATDANGTTQKNAEAITAAKADYLLALKGNRGPIYEQTRTYFETHPAAEGTVHIEHDKGHGRLETRTTRAVSAAVLPDALRSKWSGLRTLVQVRRERVSGKWVSDETHYYLSSLEQDAATLADRIRSYWSVENQLHWVLDVTMGEDRCRVRNLRAAENWGTLRRHARNLLSHPGAGRGSIVMKQRKAGWDENYLWQLLALSDLTARTQAP